jgi:hypothetical protein
MDYTKLKELHAAVKQHPHRMPKPAASTREPYAKLMRAMLTEAYDVTCKDVPRGSRSPEGVAVSGMYHDFSSKIGACSYYGLDKLPAGSVLHLERGIATLHQLCDTGTIQDYWTYYTGCNNYANMDRHRRYVREGDEFVAVYTRKELDAVLAEFDKRLAKQDGKYERFMYSEASHEHFKAALARLDTRTVT